MSDVQYEEVLYSVEDPIATITLNRPDRLNAWTDRMGAEVKHAFARAEADPAVVAHHLHRRGARLLLGRRPAGAAGDQRRRLAGGRPRRARGRPRRRDRRSQLPRPLLVPDVDRQAGHRRHQRPLRRHGRADRALLRHAIRGRERGVHHRVRAARADRRVGIELDADPRRGPGPCDGPVDERAQGARRRGRAHRPWQNASGTSARLRIIKPAW